MGCVSSKPLKKNLKHKVLLVNAAELSNHVVSLTSSTYGALKLDRDAIFLPSIVGKTSNLPHVKETHQGEVIKKNNNQVAVVVPKVEVINTWELMSDLEDEIPEVAMSSNSCKKEGRSPFKRVSSMMSNNNNNLINSPKGGVGKLDGKENKGGPQINYTTPKGRVFKPWKVSTGSNDRERKLVSSSPRRSNSGSRRRRSLGPLFDPELIDSFEKELSMEEEQIKKMVSPKECSSVLEKYQKLCPPGGEHCVVIYTTTLRGIRKTFEDCNVVRSAIESYQIRVIERDISMDSGFKEELRKLMGRKDVKVPAVFVKGRLIGGANEVVKLDEEGRLEGLLAGISKAVLGCQGCGGIRFVMCSECNGSCKVLDQRHKCMVRCGECNENGLIHCPLCSSSLIT